ncbi:transposase [Streptomyces mauvecolor]|uniref:Transposase n=1 Tax=Streptomyces mauvecolor TaxID=58345 RepID=A0ABV9UK99_9ACTN
MSPGRGVRGGDLRVLDGLLDGIAGRRGGVGRSSGRSVSRIAAGLGVNHERLRQWIKTAERAEQPEAVAALAKDAEPGLCRKPRKPG